jgi:hypothetical protein
LRGIQSKADSQAALEQVRLIAGDLGADAAVSVV